MALHRVAWYKFTDVSVGLAASRHQGLQRTNPEDSHFHIRYRKNLKSHVSLTGLTPSFQQSLV
jgi:hypothetical protein